MTTYADDPIGQHEQLVAVADLMNDDEFTDAVNEILRVMRRPDMLPQRASTLIQKLQATATLMGIRKQWYVAYGPKTPEGKFKKNMYFTIEERLDKMVDALKYMAKV